MTRSLAELLESIEGRLFLEKHGVYVDAPSFVEAMGPTHRADLLESLGLPGNARLVYSGQQTQCDYGHSVTAKFRAQRDLGEAPDVVPITLPLDMDRAGSSKWNTTLSWPGDGKTLTARLVPHRLAEVEMRFTPVVEDRLREVVGTVGQWISAWVSDAGAAPVTEERYAAFVATLIDGPPRTLAEANRALTSWLLRAALAFEPPIVLVSELLRQGLLREAIDQVVACSDDVITVFNEAVGALMAADVDPKVRALPPDYLPLWYSCPEDGKRCRLVSHQQGGDRYAVSQCRSCGSDYRFHLAGSGSPIDELASTGRWSVDVTLPVYVNQYASGVVAGQSTALYGLIMNEVGERVLGARPVPMLIPSDIGEPPEGGFDSLFFQCLTGAT